MEAFPVRLQHSRFPLKNTRPSELFLDMIVGPGESSLGLFCWPDPWRSGSPHGVIGMLDASVLAGLDCPTAAEGARTVISIAAPAGIRARKRRRGRNCRIATPWLMEWHIMGTDTILRCKIASSFGVERRHCKRSR